MGFQNLYKMAKFLWFLLFYIDYNNGCILQSSLNYFPCRQNNKTWYQLLFLKNQNQNDVLILLLVFPENHFSRPFFEFCNCINRLNYHILYRKYPANLETTFYIPLSHSTINYLENHSN